MFSRRELACSAKNGAIYFHRENAERQQKIHFLGETNEQTKLADETVVSEETYGSIIIFRGKSLYTRYAIGKWKEKIWKAINKDRPGGRLMSSRQHSHLPRMCLFLSFRLYSNNIPAPSTTHYSFQVSIGNLNSPQFHLNIRPILPTASLPLYNFPMHLCV